MAGLIEEGSEAVEKQEGVLRDLAIIAGAQRVEHYEISAYGTARTLAEQLGMNQAAELLQQTEDEEKGADTTLTNVAMGLYESANEDESESEGVEAGELETVRARKPSVSGNSSRERGSRKQAVAIAL